MTREVLLLNGGVEIDILDPYDNEDGLWRLTGCGFGGDKNKVPFFKVINKDFYVALDTHNSLIDQFDLVLK